MRSVIADGTAQFCSASQSIVVNQKVIFAVGLSNLKKRYVVEFTQLEDKPDRVALVAARWAHTNISESSTKRNNQMSCVSSCVFGIFFTLLVIMWLSYAWDFQMLGISSVKRYSPCFPPIPSRQGAPTRIQSQARICCLPYQSSSR